MTVCSRRRLLFLCPVLDAGGAERHWASLLPALRERGFGVRLVALHGGGRQLEHLRRSEGVPVRELGSSGVRSLRLLPEVLREGRGHPDVLVTFGYNAHAIGSLAARMLEIPHVLNWHRQEGFPMSCLEQGAVRLAARLGAGAIAVTKAQVPDLTRLGFPEARVRVVANGTSRPMLEKDPGATRRDLGLPPTAFVPLLVARLRPEKRIVDFIDACASLRASVPRTLGVVVGDGPLAGTLREYAAQQGAPVRFAGYQADPIPWMHAADVVCLTSSHEALPLVLIEALACARPCIATSVGGAREIVEEGVNGHLIPVRDVRRLVSALRSLALDPPLTHRMGACSLERWRSMFSLDSMADAYAECLCSVRGMPVAWA